ncbi:MAG: helix-turn-helix transcriptional regulator [Bacteroidales bacterium]|nr:helix-turn-helix transcriptional regulator [Bacteroidales bacterium]
MNNLFRTGYFIAYHQVVLCFLIILIFLSVSLSVYGNAHYHSVSKNELIEKCEEALSIRDYTSLGYYASSLLLDTETDKSGNDYACSLFYKGISEVFSDNPKQGISCLMDAKSLAEKNCNDTLTGKILNCLGIYEAKVNANYYLAQHYLLKSLEYPGGKGGAYSNLAQIARLQKDTSGIQYARKCYEYGVERKDSYYMYSGLVSIAEFQIFREEYDDALTTLSIADSIGRMGKYADRIRLDLLKGVILSHKNQTLDSNRILLSIKDSIQRNAPIYLHELQFVVGKNFEKEGKIDESNEWLLKALVSSDRYSSSDYRAMIAKQIADNYYSQGMFMNAYHYLGIAYEAESNAALTECDRMVKERSLTLALMKEEHETELERQKATIQRTVIVLLSVLLVLSMIVIVLVLRTIKHRKRQYRNLVNQNLRILKENAEFETRIASLEHLQTQATYPSSELNSNKSADIFKSLQKLMTQDHLFKDPLLTREKIIELLGTNPTYLTKCIKENADMNYSQYINSFRIAEVLRLMEIPTYKDSPIMEIAGMAGFNSQTTFYKIFQQTTGLSPSAYRKKLREI